MNKRHIELSGDLFPEEPRLGGGETHRQPVHGDASEPKEPLLAPGEMERAAEALAASAEDSPLGEPPESSDDKWWEKTPKKEPYKFGERIDRVDTDRLYLCPECGAKNKSKPDIDSKWGEMRFVCSRDNNHHWVFIADKEPASRGGIIKDLNERLDSQKNN